MQRRTKWMRENLAALLNDGQERKPSPKVMLKGGYFHMIRGANCLNGFDLGALVDEVAALSDDRAFRIIVLPGPGSRQAVPGGGSVSSDEYDELQAGDLLTRVLSNPNAAGHEVIDLRALRRLAMRGLEACDDPTLVPNLLEALATERDIETSSILMSILGRMKVPAALPRLAELLRSPDSDQGDLSWSVIEAVSAIAGKRSLPWPIPKAL